MKCRHCSAPLVHTFIDLGFAPPSNAYLTESDLTRPETYYPLHVKVCDECWLVQTIDYATASELFDENYAYFSSASSSWLRHSEKYCEKIVGELNLSGESFVVEVACNDGYLLKYFLANGIPCLGVEPTESTASAAEKIGIPVLKEFFTESLAADIVKGFKNADLIIGNNVFAHVPDINDFTRGLKAALSPFGVITLEFPHLMQLIRHTEFDTIYHEHFSYLSLTTVNRIFNSSGLRIWDVEELPTHGGSLRVYGCNVNDPRPTKDAVSLVLNREHEFGLQNISTYLDFKEKVNRVKNEFLYFLVEKIRQKKTVVGYGAAAKGSTLLNYAGVKPDLLPVIFDTAQSKQLKFMPGSHIPILSPDKLDYYKPDYIVIFPWNLSREIVNSYAHLGQEGVKFVTFIPHLTIL